MFFNWHAYDFFLEPACKSGLGDRLVEIWSLATIAELLHPGAKTASLWIEKGEKPTAERDYAPLYTVENIDFVKQRPLGTMRVSRYFDRTHVNDECIRELPNGLRQIQLRRATAYGRHNPGSILAEAGHYGLPDTIRFDDIAATYRQIAAGTRPAACVERELPADIDERIGIHVRLGDKLLAEEKERAMDMDRWKTIERRALARIDDLAATGEKLFVCSDDIEYRDTLAGRIRDKGGDAIVYSPAGDRKRPAGFAAQVDFFALARCRQIIQVTRYSNFSLAAAIMANCELVNFDPLAEGEENPPSDWKGAVEILQS